MPSSSGPLDQAAATRAAYQHADVVAANQRLHDYLRSRGVDDPEDPRYIFKHPAIADDPQYKTLVSEADEAFRRVRRDLMDGLRGKLN
ncbi:MAG: hypothetical protein WD078_08775 [Woeseia sp.]